MFEDNSVQYQNNIYQQGAALNSQQPRQEPQVATLEQRVRAELVYYLGNQYQAQVLNNKSKGLDINKLLGEADRIAGFILQGKVPSASIVTFGTVREPLDNEADKQ